MYIDKSEEEKNGKVWKSKKNINGINDFRAIKNNRIAKRIGWRIGGKISNNFLNKLFK